MTSFVSRSPDETEALGYRLSQKLHPGDLIAFYGPMGMGKTVFTRGIAKGLGVEKGVSSPTFAIVHEYKGNFPIYHFDMYRIESFDDLYSCGFFDYLDGESIVIVEWSENIEKALPQNAIKVSFQYGETENERIIEITGITI